MRRVTVGWLVALAAVAGVVLRVVVWGSRFGRLDGDEATVGIVAHQILHGTVGAFWPGEQYGGTLEPILTAPLVGLFGMSLAAVRAVPLVLAVVACFLTWQLGRETVGEPAGRIGAALFWIAPAYWIWFSEQARGFYEAGIVLELAALILVVRLERQDSRREAALLGLVIGAGVWQTPAVLPAIVPALVWLLWRRPSLVRHAVVAVPAAVLGGLPWLLFNIHHDWASLSASSGVTPYPKRLRATVSSTFPMSVNLRIPFTSAWLLGTVLSVLAYAALLGVGARWAWRRRRSPSFVLAIVAVAFVPLSAVSPYTWRTDEPRYLVPLMPVLALIVASMAARRQLVAALVVCAALATTIVGLGDLGTEPQFDMGADQITPLVKELDSRHITSFCASPLIAFRVDFVTNLRITGGECETHTLGRRGTVVYPATSDTTSFPKLRQAVAARHYPAWVFIAGSADDVHGRALLERAGYRRTTRTVFAVYAR